jgi:hypothetical protein
LFADTFRGVDSTGAFAVSPEGGVHMVKKAMAAPDFLETRLWSDFKTDARDCKFIVGHNRKATVGTVKTINAHPFQHGNITLVHNGSLSSMWRSDLGVMSNGFTVDSEAITYALSQAPAEEVLPKIGGAFTLVWYDATLSQLRFIRNDERPLYIQQLDGCFVFGSEKKMIEWISERNGFTAEKEAWLMKPGTLFSYELKENKYRETTVKLREPENKWGGYHTTSHNPTTRVYNSELDKFGLSYGEIIPWRLLDKVHLRSAATWIDFHGEPMFHEGFDVKCMSVPKEMFNLSKGTRLLGRITRVEKNLNGDPPTLIVGTLERVTDSNRALRKKYAPKASKGGFNNVVMLPGKEVKDTDLFKDETGKSVTAREMDVLVKNGCGLCACTLVRSDYGKLGWIGDSAICPSCVEDELFDQYGGRTS